MKNWLKCSSIDFNYYDLPEDINSGDWHYLFNDLKEDYAAYCGWDEDEYWDEDDDKLYEAECEAYEVIGELREKYN